VERHPIQESPPLFRPAGHEIVNLRVYNLQRQRLGQGGCAGGIFAADSNFEPLSAISNANVNLSFRTLHLAEKNEAVFSVLCEICCAGAPEGLTPAQIR
jgi:hypothetical protein